ncbi:MAG: crotonase/enoyl-CoA hydratase family protein [Pseudomonadales bacterium]
MSSYECFTVKIENDVAQIVLNRPDKRNSMNRAFWQELPAIVNDIDHNVKARVIVISSTGPHFSAGLDLTMFAGDSSKPKSEDALQSEGLRFYENVLHMQKSFNCLESCRLPVLAAIQGGAIGGGVDLVSACDIRYATEDAFLTIQEINIGMTADVGTFPRLVKLIPEGIVRELAYTGRRFGANEAKQVGLVNQVFADQASMLDAVLAIARQIASKAPVAIYGSKRMINYARDHSTADGLDYIGIWNASMLNVGEIQEAIGANGEQRPGRFAALPNKQ